MHLIDCLPSKRNVVIYWHNIQTLKLKNGLILFIQNLDCFLGTKTMNYPEWGKVYESYWCFQIVNWLSQQTHIWKEINSFIWNRMQVYILESVKPNDPVSSVALTNRCLIPSTCITGWDKIRSYPDSVASGNTQCYMLMGIKTIMTWLTSLLFHMPHATVHQKCYTF